MTIWLFVVHLSHGLRISYKMSFMRLSNTHTLVLCLIYLIITYFISTLLARETKQYYQLDGRQMSTSMATSG